MAIIKKKTWPELFQKVLEGKKNADVRLADFQVSEGDTLVLEEYNPETKSYSGRSITKKVKAVSKIDPASYSSLENIKKYGQWLMELE